MADQDIEVKRSQTPQTPQGSQQGSQTSRTPAPMRRSGFVDPFQSFHNEMDRMFDQLWRGFGLPPMRRSFEGEPSWQRDGGPALSTPAVDVAEDEKAYHITAELPGLADKDIEVNLSDDVLTISGEKRDEREEKEKNYHFSERRYGSFRRSFVVPQNIDRDKIEASFKNGVLALTLPKSADAVQRQKKIEIKTP